MNVSGRTKILLEGAYLWACVQDTSRLDPAIQENWNIWANNHPFMVALAKKIQYETFDRINMIFTN